MTGETHPEAAILGTSAHFHVVKVWLFRFIRAIECSSPTNCFFFLSGIFQLGKNKFSCIQLHPPILEKLNIARVPHFVTFSLIEWLSPPSFQGTGVACSLLALKMPMTERPILYMTILMREWTKDGRREGN